MKTVKIGNSTLKFNDSRAVRTQTEIDNILDNIAIETQKSLISAAVEKNTA